MKQNMVYTVLLSGGLDSACALAHAVSIARTNHPADYRLHVKALSIDYGQRHSCEIEHARALAEHYGVEHTVLPISSLFEGSLLTTDRALPNASYADLAAGVSPTYVPFRNGVFISVLAAFSQREVLALNRDDYSVRALAYIGIHAEDASRDAYPDCSVDFYRSMRDAVSIGTYGLVELVAPFVSFTKAQVVEDGYRRGVPFSLTWSCYAGGTDHCGTCPTCRARKEAFRVAGISDPTRYLA